MSATAMDTETTNDFTRANSTALRKQMQKLSFANIVTVPAQKKHSATVIFLHGLGDSGDGWAYVLQQIQSAGNLGHVKFLCPSAGNRRVTINGGRLMPAWFDILSFDKANRKEDYEGTLGSSQEISALIQQEIDEHKIPSNRIVVAGFSQGGCIAVATGLVTTQHKLAGVASLSSFFLLKDELPNFTDSNLNTPVVMYHGTADPVVELHWGKVSHDLVRKARIAKGLAEVDAAKVTQFKSYEGLKHTSSPQELRDFMDFLSSVIGEQTSV